MNSDKTMIFQRGLKISPEMNQPVHDEHMPSQEKVFHLTSLHTKMKYSEQGTPNTQLVKLVKLTSN